MKKVPVTLSINTSNDIPLLNHVLVSNQIEGLKEVLRRMKAAKSETLAPIISKKLQNFTYQ